MLDVVSAAQFRQWARDGAGNKLERAVLAGQGRRLLAGAEALPLSHHLPALVAKCDALHAAVEKGSLLELKVLVTITIAPPGEVLLAKCDTLKVKSEAIHAVVVKGSPLLELQVLLTISHVVY